MSKRFIDTGLFDDDWFMDLSKDAKILWMYFITKCDHAGILRLNMKLCKVQTGINDILSVTEELGNRLVIVSEHLYFIPKYIEFQYPGFPNSKVRQQISAVDILTKHRLYVDGKLTVTEELGNSYVNDTVNDTVNVNEEVRVKFLEFWDKYQNITGMTKTEEDPAFKYWKRMNKAERQKALDNIKPYFDSLNDKKYCKKARTYLSDKNFNDEFKLSVIPKRTETNPGAYGGLLPNPEHHEDIYRKG